MNFISHNLNKNDTQNQIQFVGKSQQKNATAKKVENQSAKLYFPAAPKKAKYSHYENFDKETIKQGMGYIENYQLSDVSNKQFAHIFGNNFVSNTNLEGHNLNDTFAYLSTFIKRGALPT